MQLHAYIHTYIHKQVECNFIHTYIHKQVECSRIKSLNESVRELGREKVDVMTEMKDFRTKIHAINWELECLEFRAEEVCAHVCVCVCIYIYIYIYIYMEG